MLLLEQYVKYVFTNMNVSDVFVRMGIKEISVRNAYPVITMKIMEDLLQDVFLALVMDTLNFVTLKQVSY